MNKMKYIVWIIFFIFTHRVYAEMVYPIQTMSKLDCRFAKYSTLWDDCKMPLPILKTSDYSQYKNDYSLYRRVYTILWWSTYDYGWDVGNGGHGWVDIASSEWTPVYAITDGKVVFAWSLAWWWNVIKIEHTINARKVYSNYAHLSKIDISLWDIVKTKTKIWEIWTTWNSFWNHLHFQIDLSTSWKWPRYRSNCKEKNYENIVNSNVCFDQLNINTIDPLLFLETQGAIVKLTEIDKPKQEIISQKSILSRQEILKREIQDFLKLYQVKVNIINLWWNIELGKNGVFRITVTDKRTKKPFTGSFPWDMNFKYDGKKFDIFPAGILQIDNGIREFKVTPKMSWKMSLDIYMGDTFFKKVTFWVMDTKKAIIPHNWTLSVKTNNVISDNNKWLFYFKDNYGLNILWFKFDGNYTLTSENKTMKFCLKKANSFSEILYTYNSKCDEKSFKDSLSFSYKDTIAWVLIFEYKTLNIWVNTIAIQNQSKKITTKKIAGTLPNGLDINYSYYNDILKVSQLWIASWINAWYFLQDRELSTLDGINFIIWAIQYKLSKCWDINCKNKYYEKIVSIWNIQTDKYTYFTRWEYIKLMADFIYVPDYVWNDYIDFRDITPELKVSSKNILKNKTWNDYFGKTKYFQPDKKITRWEWAFLISNVLE